MPRPHICPHCGERWSRSAWAWAPAGKEAAVTFSGAHHGVVERPHHDRDHAQRIERDRGSRVDHHRHAVVAKA
jgi:hypothetical protein